MASIVRPLGHFGRPLLFLLLSSMTVLSVNAQSYFSCLNGEGNIFNATVIVPAASGPNINGEALSPGSEIGIYTSNPEFANTCVGKLSWDGSTGAVVVWGDDDLTSDRDGLFSGDELRFKIWDSASGLEYKVDPQNATFLDSDGRYEHDKIFVLSSLDVVFVEVAMAANSDQATTDEDVAVSIDVLANDEGGSSGLDPASVAILTPPTRGIVSAIDVTNGRITYTPNANESGQDSFSYQVFNSAGSDSRTATVDIVITEVNDAPIALDDVASVAEDGEITVSILSNDSDVDNDLLDPASVVVTSAPVFGEIVTVNATTGEITYRPDLNYHGPDGFSYSVRDMRGAESTAAQVSIDVTSINDAPIATEDASISDEDTQAKIDVLANDADVDGDEIDAGSVQIRVFPSHGRIKSIHTTTGQITYVPDPDYSGNDSFSYKVRDIYGKASNEVFVSITVNPVNDSPRLNKKPVESTPKGKKYKHEATFTDPDEDQLSIAAVVAPSWLSATDHGNGVLELEGTPPLTITGEFQVGLVADDGNNGVTTYDFTLVVAENAAPVGGDDFASSQEDQSVVINVLANDVDPEGDTLNTASVSIESPPTHGSILGIDPATGDITYSPEAEFSGTDSFEYTVLDEIGNRSNVIRVTIEIAAVSDAPVAVPDIVDVLEDNDLIVDVLRNDSDADGDPLWIVDVASPEYGVVQITDDYQDIIYTPNPDFNGSDSFSYTVADSDGRTSEAVVTVTVAGVNDAPELIYASEQTLSAGATFTSELRVSDVDGDPVNLSVVSGPSWISITSTGATSYNITANPQIANLGLHTAILRVSDGVVSVDHEITFHVSEIQVQLPQISDLYSPADNEIDVSVSTKFSWRRVDGASEYQLQITTLADASFANTLFDRKFLYGTSAVNAVVNLMVFNLPDDTEMIWRVRAFDGATSSPWSSPNLFSTGSGISTPVEEEVEVPTAMELFQNYPNPFNPVTTIGFNLTSSSDVNLIIYDLMGREVERLASGFMPAGRHEVRWNAGNRASGVYLYRLQAGAFSETKTLTLLK